MDQVQVENAIHAWLVAATGLPPEKVILSDQDGRRPARPFITYAVGDLVSLNRHPELQTNTDLTRPEGQEIEHLVIDRGAVTVSVQAFSADAHGASSARALLQKAKTGLALPGVRTALVEAGLAVFDPGTVTAVRTVLETRTESRAVLEPRFYVAETASELLGYIAAVEVNGELIPTAEE